MKSYTLIGRAIPVGLIMLALTSCLSPVKSDRPNTYQLNAVPLYVKTKPMRNITLLVMQPEVAVAYNTTQMAYTRRPYEISYFGKNNWIGTPAQMMQPLMVQTLQNTHHFRAVVTPPFIAKYDYVLTAQIIKIQQDFTRNPPIFHLIMNVELTRAISNQIIATRQFNLNEPLWSCTPYGGVIAGNRATKRMLTQLAEFVLANT